MKRRLAREIAVQSLYQMEMNEVGAAEAVNMLINEAAEDNETEVVIHDADVMRTYVTEMVQGAWNNKEAIDGLLVEYLKGWQISRLSRVDRQILRLSTYEMVFRDDIPAKVSVNEAIELSKYFGTDESGKFVNGVLGRMIQEVSTIKAKLS
jgi:N utilization substance protein B